MRRKLLDKGYDASVVGPLMARLQAEKLLDDRRFLDNFVAYRAARGQGPIRVCADLRRIGMRGELVEACLDAYPDWSAQLKRAREKKFGTSIPTHYADRARQTRFLGYRGFTGAQIRTALGSDTDLDTDTDL